MSAQSPRSDRPVVVLGVRRSYIDLIILSPPKANSERVVRSRTVRWRKDSAGLSTEVGLEEFRYAMRLLVAEERLAGSQVSICLDGDFCVTRVVTGANEHVRRELAHLEERSSLYLSLGIGSKALAHSIRQIDARHQHAMLTVVNQQVLDGLAGIATQLGLNVDRIEPSLVALCRAVGHGGHDADRPVLIIHIGERGLELGISHRGQLLLDYRPGGRDAHQEVATTVSRHLVRLQRYCQRYFRMAGAQIENVYLCGSPDAMQQAKLGFEAHNLRVHEVEPTTIEPAWRFSTPAESTEISSSLGTCLVRIEAAEANGPNLIDRMSHQGPPQTVTSALRTLWPVAAALLLAAGLTLAGVAERFRGRGVDAELASLDEQHMHAARMLRQISHADARLASLAAIRDEVHSRAWSQILANIAGSLPADVWLESLVVSESELRLAGLSFSEDGVFEFADWLKKNPHLTNLAVEEARRTTLQSGPATRFGISATIVEGPAENGSIPHNPQNRNMLGHSTIRAEAN